jgi:signal transduction histidine kinase
VTRIRHVAREHWFELLIAVMAIAGMLELVVGRDSPGAPATSLWFSVPAVAVLVLPLFLHRRFPFAAPAAYWFTATALTFLDGLLIQFIGSLGVVGLATAFLLGNLRDDRQAGIGLAIVLGCIVVVVANIPGAQSGSDLVFIPLRFVVAWIAGYALRERAEQAEAAEMRATLAEREREAAEMRATLAERERDAAARIAVAEERARMARELHEGRARARRAGRPHRARRDAPPARSDAPRRRRRRARPAAGPRCPRLARGRCQSRRPSCAPAR